MLTIRADGMIFGRNARREMRMKCSSVIVDRDRILGSDFHAIAQALSGDAAQ